MKSDFSIVHQQVMAAFVSMGGTKYFRPLRNNILKNHGWNYADYESECLVRFTDRSN